MVRPMVSAMRSRRRSARAHQNSPSTRIRRIERILPGRRKPCRRRIVQRVTQVLCPIACRFHDNHAFRHRVPDCLIIVWPP